MSWYRPQACAISTILCLLLVFWPLPGLGQDDPLRHGHALIIGAWAYNDHRWPRLDDVQLQIQQLETALRPHFDDVAVLRNPSFDQLDTGLQRFLRTLGNNDDSRLLIYYAGHGYTEVNSSRNEYRGYITGFDTPYVDGTQEGFATARVKALSMEAIRGMVSDVNARQLLFIFDSCFAGTVFSARSPARPLGRLSENDIERLIKQPVREFITAGDMQEQIPAHSPLPQLLVNALEGEADPYGLGVITGQQIAQYLWSQTRSAGISPREGKLPGGYFDRGEFLFRVGVANLRPPRIAPPPPPVISQAVMPRAGSEAIPTDKPGLNYPIDFGKGSSTPYGGALIFVHRVARDWVANGGASKVLIKLKCYGDGDESRQVEGSTISRDRANTVVSLLANDGVPRDMVLVETVDTAKIMHYANSSYTSTDYECEAILISR